MLILFMNLFTLSSSIEFIQYPSVLKWDPMINALALKYCSKLVSVTPEPISIGSETLVFSSCNSCVSAGLPVDVPVKITPSERKNSAALAVSVSDTSAVIACELQNIGASIRASHIRASSDITARLVGDKIASNKFYILLFKS